MCYSYISLFWTSNRWFSKMKSPMWKNWTVYTHILTEKFKTTKHLMIFLRRKQFFQKNSTGEGWEMIVLNPFLDSLWNSAFKNISLTPGIPKGCFQHPQDAVNIALIAVCFKYPKIKLQWGKAALQVLKLHWNFILGRIWGYNFFPKLQIKDFLE